MTISLSGVRILVVEDNYVLADATRSLLTRCDGTVTAIASTVTQAFAALDASGADVAVLDVNLNGTSIVTLAERLRAAGIPFLFMTGFGDDPDLLPAHLREYPRLEKPVEAERLVGVLAGLVGR